MLTAAPFHPHPRLTQCLAAATNGAHPFRVSMQRWDDVVVLRVGGDVDAANVATWSCLLAEAAAAAAPGLLVIDTDDLRFMGLSGFAAMAELSQRTRGSHLTVCLASHRPTIARIITACQWQQDLPVYSSIDAAVDAHTEGQDASPAE